MSSLYSIEHNYNVGLNLIINYLQLASVPHTVASNKVYHRTIRFRHNGWQHEVNGIIGQRVAMLKNPMPEIIKRIDGGQVSMSAKVEIEYKEGPLLFGVWEIPCRQLFVDENPLAVVEFIMHDLK